LGPVASQVAIKQLGSNGGGFFNVNSAHPFENPTFFSNFVELLAILLIPVALIYTYSLLIESKKHGLVLGSVMLALFLIGLATTIYSYIYPNPNLNSFPALEGKEARFGLMGTQLWTVSSMATGNGSVNSMMSSASPLSGGIPIFYMLIGELVFGAVGVGLKGMLMYVLLAVFLEVKEIQWIVISVLMPTALVLLGTSLCCLLPAEMRGSSQEGPHAFTEILYALSSVASNNGSSFASLNTNTNYYNFLLGIIMLIGRWTSVIPSLAVAGLLAKKRRIPPSAGVFSTNSLLFGILLFSVIALIGMLSLFPFFSLGPLAEFFLMKEARVF
jgi:K+-transporting ATPase ATPase A chain